MAFRVDGLDQLVVVMWSVPYSHDLHANWLAVGQLKEGHGNHCFNEMYYGSPTYFDRKEYYK